jgi:hypothetical protein
MFLFIYGIIGGIGFGVCYFLPIVCAWSHFSQNQRPLISGVILCAFSFNALACTLYTTHIINPYNEKPEILVQRGENVEKYFAVDSQ